MMNRAIIVFSIIILTACGKASMDPVFNNSPLIGTWISRTGSPVMNIKNLKNEGTTEKYYEYTESGFRYLRRTYNGIPTTYQIIYIDGIELKLASQAGQVDLLRAGN